MKQPYYRINHFKKNLSANWENKGEAWVQVVQQEYKGLRIAQWQLIFCSACEQQLLSSSLVHSPRWSTPFLCLNQEIQESGRMNTTSKFDKASKSKKISRSKTTSKFDKAYKS